MVDAGIEPATFPVLRCKGDALTTRPVNRDTAKVQSTLQLVLLSFFRGNNQLDDPKVF